MNIKKVLFRIGCAFAFVGSLASCGENIAGVQAVMTRAVYTTPTVETLNSITTVKTMPAMYKCDKDGKTVAFIVGDAGVDTFRVYAYDKTTSDNVLGAVYDIKDTSSVASVFAKEVSTNLEDKILDESLIKTMNKGTEDEFKAAVASVHDDFFTINGKVILPDATVYAGLYDYKAGETNKLKYWDSPAGVPALKVEAKSLSGFSTGTGSTIFFEYEDHTIVAQIGIFTAADWLTAIFHRATDATKAWVNEITHKDASDVVNSSNTYFIKKVWYFDSKKDVSTDLKNITPEFTFSYEENTIPFKKTA
jgi:hypothetical protein